MFNRFSSRLSLKDQATFAKRLAFLIKADVPILESLRMMQRQSKSSARARILDEVINDVANGQFLSTSLAKHRRAFGDFAINIIKVGEEAGILDRNLEYLAEELRKRQELKKKIIGASIYPIFIAVSTLGISGLITTYVFPKLTPIFNSFSADLPPTTKALIFISNFLLNYGVYLILGLIFASFAFMVAYKKIKPLNYTVNHILLSIPLFGNLIQNYQMANFCRTLGLLLNCQVNIVGATSITADATANLIYKREIHELAKEITKGKKIYQRLELQPRLFPDMVPELITIGETTGKLDETLLYLGNYYENEVNEMTKNLSSIIEPFLLVFMGIIVGFVAVSVITPIYELTQNIHP